MTKLLQNKVAVISGANRGIGKSIAETYAESGANIIACMRSLNPEIVVWMNKLENKFNISVKPVLVDLSDQQSVKKSIKEIMGISKKIDILVNNAGIASGALFQMTTGAELRKIFEINFFSQIVISQGIAKIMVKNKSGSIINLSSTAAFIADPGTLAYGSSKSAFARATQSMASELGSSNIRVNAIAPGVTKTDMFEQMSIDARDKLINSSALKRAADPLDIANVALFLASDLSSFVTGQVIRVDGGIS
ncbi:SDR family oxidoreductase [Candidatus Thioglobus sp.]|nr:SDR family oxidoreductase [Candidatus Thioglobus sp.]MDA9060387.1 SDR family oxidoreductase [Candidatus Thioglobus sp.]